ncbi:MAG: hypothetical protein Ct9H300mP28_11560 [Pseudomonadota bacterium]|nr:MAG: hypothetical protein Ct9H300mP28_11560 [Pseudomonadota bacterium]
MTPGVNPEDAHYSEQELRVGVNEGHRLMGNAPVTHRVCRNFKCRKCGMDSIEHGIFMTQECLEAMLKQQTYLVPTLSAVNNIYLNRDNGIPDFIVEKTLRIREHHHNSIKIFIRLEGKWRWVQMRGPH